MQFLKSKNIHLGRSCEEVHKMLTIPSTLKNQQQIQSIAIFFFRTYILHFSQLRYVDEYPMTIRSKNLNPDQSKR